MTTKREVELAEKLAYIELQLDIEKSDAKQERRELKRAVEAAQKDARQRKKELEAAKQDAIQLQDEYTRLEKELETTEAEHLTLSRELMEAKFNNKRLTNQLDNLLKAGAPTRPSEQGSDLELEVMQALETQGEIISDLQNVLNTTEAELDRTMAELGSTTAERDTLRTEPGVSQNRYDTLFRDVEALRQQFLKSDDGSGRRVFETYYSVLGHLVFGSEKHDMDESMGQQPRHDAPRTDLTSMKVDDKASRSTSTPASGTNTQSRDVSMSDNDQRPDRTPKRAPNPESKNNAKIVSDPQSDASRKLGSASDVADGAGEGRVPSPKPASTPKPRGHATHHMEPTRAATAVSQPTCANKAALRAPQPLTSTPPSEQKPRGLAKFTQKVGEAIQKAEALTPSGKEASLQDQPRLSSAGPSAALRPGSNPPSKTEADTTSQGTALSGRESAKRSEKAIGTPLQDTPEPPPEFADRYAQFMTGPRKPSLPIKFNPEIERLLRGEGAQNTKPVGTKSEKDVRGSSTKAEQKNRSAEVDTRSASAGKSRQPSTSTVASSSAPVQSESASATTPPASI